MKILLLARQTLFSQPGGDTIQVEQTALFLRQIGFSVYCHTARGKYEGSYDILHYFNLSRPAALLPYLPDNKPLVVSSIYIDYSEYDSKNRSRISSYLYGLFGQHTLEYIKTVARWIRGNDAFPGFPYLFAGQKKSILKVLKNTSAIIAASNYELDHIKKDFGFIPSTSHVINLGIEHIKDFNSAGSKRDGVICVARIEGLKNQFNLIRAINQSSYSLKLIGAIATNQQKYYQQCKAIANENVNFSGSMNYKEICEELKNAGVHALPSYFETTGLATLEALYMGCQAVVSNRGAQKEIFGDHVFYCDPGDPASIKEAIDRAMGAKDNHNQWVVQNFSWNAAAEKIGDIYRKLVSNP